MQVNQRKRDTQRGASTTELPSRTRAR